ncbi:hypothetical protein R1flu_004861 [Riccia fluitans]|uniref:Uncharacterized protein n=1 Tax=Riccia fluitans TaxID=41844 RepID=A0ABD1YVH5_9MARC
MEAKAGYSRRSPSQGSPPLANLRQWRRRPAIQGEALAAGLPPLAKCSPMEANAGHPRRRARHMFALTGHDSPSLAKMLPMKATFSPCRHVDFATFFASIGEPSLATLAFAVLHLHWRSLRQWGRSGSHVFLHYLLFFYALPVEAKPFASGGKPFAAPGDASLLPLANGNYGFTSGGEAPPRE